MRQILFIVEKSIVDGKNYLGSSNDLLLICQALRMGSRVYLATPNDIHNCKNHHQLSVLKLSDNLNWQQIDDEIKFAWHQEVVNCLVTLPLSASDEQKLRSKILLLDATTEEIDINAMPVFNRSEPTSLTNQFYDLLITLQKNGAKILPNPHLNKTLGDKLAVYAIHCGQTIGGIDLLAGVSFQNEENKISFESEIISISNNNLSASEIAQFYDLIWTENFTTAKNLFANEYQIFIEGAQKYLIFHEQLKNDSIIKPANYFGGSGVVVVKNKTLDLNQATKNIVQSFFSIKRDCQRNNSGNLAFLSKIIVQERATEACLGDLRIVMCGKNLQGIFVRVNRNFSHSNASNLHFGGHPESLFKHYEINKDGVDRMIGDMVGCDQGEIKKTQALYGLLKILDFLQQIKTLHKYPIIGVDALLTKDKNGNYKYGINEINLTSPMGQTQLLILQMAIKFSDLATEILRKNNFKIDLKKHQILADYFKDGDLTQNILAKNILLQNHHLQNLITLETEKLLANNFANNSIDFF